MFVFLVLEFSKLSLGAPRPQALTTNDATTVAPVPIPIATTPTPVGPSSNANSNHLPAPKPASGTIKVNVINFHFVMT